MVPARARNSRSSSRPNRSRARRPLPRRSNEDAVDTIGVRGARPRLLPAPGVPAVCAWKTPRSAPKVALNTEPAVRAATRRALADPDEAVRMQALLALERRRRSDRVDAPVLRLPGALPDPRRPGPGVAGGQAPLPVPDRLLAGLPGGVPRAGRRVRRLDPHAGQGAVAVVQGALGGSAALSRPARRPTRHAAPEPAEDAGAAQQCGRRESNPHGLAPTGT